MKKLILIVCVIILSNCEISVKKVNAQAEEHWTEEKLWRTDPKWDVGTRFKRILIDSMEFGLFQCEGGHGNGIPFVVNLTKEKLEVELLKKQLKK